MGLYFRFMFFLSKGNKMGKLNETPISVDDIKNFLKRAPDSESGLNDFSFELEVCKAIIDAGETDIKSGGIYFDHDLKHNREYDIRLKINLPQKNIYFHLAIECKNVQANYPLIVATSPRVKKESFLQFWSFVGRHSQKRENGVLIENRFIGHDILVDQENNPIFYPKAENVGRKCFQLGKHVDLKLGFIESESQCYDKWTQAFSSLTGMLHDACDWFLAQENDKGFVYGNHIFLPILIVPDEKLWCIGYSTPDTTSEPCQKNHIALFADRNYYINGPRGGIRPYTVSHLEIMTLSGLQEFIKKVKLSNGELISQDSARELIFHRG